MAGKPIKQVTGDKEERILPDARTLGAFVWDAGADAWTVRDDTTTSEAEASLNGTVIELDPAGTPKSRPTAHGTGNPFWVKVS